MTATTLERLVERDEDERNAVVTDADLQLPCHREDPELFFAEDPLDVELAKAVCGPCPLRSACLDAALERREPWGVWGGELVLQGAVVARKRGPGRPRKDTTTADSR